jgi:hypothetical protein
MEESTKRAKARAEKFFNQEWHNPQYLVEIKQLVTRVANCDIDIEELRNRGLGGSPDAPPGLLGWGPDHQQMFIVDVIATQTGGTRLAKALRDELKLQYGISLWALANRIDEWDRLLAEGT